MYVWWRWFDAIKLKYMISRVGFYFLRSFIVLSFIFICKISLSQVGIGTTNPHSSSILEVASTTKGMLIPRMTMAQRISINSPLEGLMVYQTDGSKGIWIFNGTEWKIAFVSTTLGVTSNSISGTGHQRIVADSIILYANQVVEIQFEIRISASCCYKSIQLSIGDLSAIPNGYVTTGSQEAYSFSGSGAVSTSATITLQNKAAGTSKFYVYMECSARNETTIPFTSLPFSANWSLLYTYY
jgi:hypothetical protein